MLAKIEQTNAALHSLRATDYESCRQLTGMLASYVAVLRQVQEVADEAPAAKRSRTGP
jgi:hypothetical protein